jgi:diaminopimelate decarboxylase
VRRAAVDERAWWTRPGLDVRGGRLFIAGRDAEALARANDTPLYVYDLLCVEEQARALRDAIASVGLEPIVRLALKAQREPELLGFLRDRVRFVQLDVCSPGELAWGRQHGWTPDEISYTGTNLADRDVGAILDAGVHVNVDLLSQLDRVGRRALGARVGIRVNPRIGPSFAGGGETEYAGERPTKFGIFAERLDEAVDIARRHELTLDTVHFHVGDGYLSDELPVFDETVRRVASMVRELHHAGCPVREVNTGGGLGVPQRPGDVRLDLDRWAAVLDEHLGALDVAVATEPGDFLVKECAIHLAEIVTVEDRDGHLFVGLDTGWNIVGEHFIYGALLDVVLCRDVDGEPSLPVTVTGHINEGDDVFAVDLPMPEVREGDVVALINVGSYNGSMYSEHCLRPRAANLFFRDRA